MEDYDVQGVFWALGEEGQREEGFGVELAICEEEGGVTG